MHFTGCMPNSGTAHETLVDDLRHLYGVEKRLLEVLLKLGDVALSPELRHAFAAHLAQTETHVEHLEELVLFLEEPATGD